ncbi:MAG: single-stranded DNA-binding protein [Cycloclasticus sp.]
MAKSGVFKITGYGNIGKTPVLSALPSGDSVLNFSLAANESWKDKNTQEEKEHTDWLDMVVFGKLAEVMGQHLQQGDPIWFEGVLRHEKWEKNGVKFSKHKCILKEFGFLNKREGSNHNANIPDARHHQNGAAPTQPIYGSEPQPNPNPPGYYFENGEAMTQQQAAFYTSRNIKPWAKGLRPPLVP